MFLLRQALALIAMRKVYQVVIPRPNGLAVFNLTQKGLDAIMKVNDLTPIYQLTRVAFGYSCRVTLKGSNGAFACMGVGRGGTPKLAQLNALRSAITPMIEWSK